MSRTEMSAPPRVRKVLEVPKVPVVRGVLEVLRVLVITAVQEKCFANEERGKEQITGPRSLWQAQLPTPGTPETLGT